MKHRKLSFWTGGLAIASLLVCGSLSAQDENGFDCLPDIPVNCSTTVDLIAAQNISLGTVVVSSNNSQICVSYILDQAALDAGWLLYEAHLAIATDLADIPQTGGNKWGTNPIPGQFPYSADLYNGEPCWTICIDLDELGLSPGDSVYIAAHAVVGFEDEQFGIMTETAWGQGDRFNERGNWGMYFMHELCEDEPEEKIVTSYIGYEDRGTGGDFDYNDFGMDFGVLETYIGNVLNRIDITLTARVNRAGDSHDIHIERVLEGDYTYTITREGDAYGTETEGTAVDASGIFDVIAFDTGKWPKDATSDQLDETVVITIIMDPENTANTLDDFDGDPDRFDLSDAFDLYDPYMVNKTQGDSIISIVDFMDAANPLPLANGDYEVPFIIVVPTDDWPHPLEGDEVTEAYEFFETYYYTKDVFYSDWWALASGPTS